MNDSGNASSKRSLANGTDKAEAPGSKPGAPTESPAESRGENHSHSASSVWTLRTQWSGLDYPFILVHSPLVGPVTWSWVARELQQRRHRVLVPSLKGAAISGSWQRCVDVAIREAPSETVVLVGHSGAGPLLPAIASRMESSPKRLVFVDAALPLLASDTPLVPKEFLDFLKGLARNGMLPKWSEWFGAGAMEELIPDDERRAAVLADLPELPLSYFTERVPMPAEWASVEGAYILLSDPYRSDAARAASRGWPVRELLGAHLDIVTRSSAVADMLLELARDQRHSPGSGIRIRPADATDVGAVARIHLASWKFGHRGLLPDEVVEGVAPEERQRAWQKTLEKPTRGKVVILAEAEAEVVGFASGGASRDPSAEPEIGEVYELFVDPQVVGTGVGETLLREIMDQLKRRGYRTVTLWVVEGNKRARHFYERLGFRPDGSRKTVAMNGAEVVEVRYRVALDK